MTINLTRFDLTTLRLFVLVVDGGSLTAGAAGFGISVAAASKRVAELEAHVGEALLERSKRGVVPTAAGRSAAAPRDRTGGPAAAAGRGDGRLPARRRRPPAAVGEHLGLQRLPAGPAGRLHEGPSGRGARPRGCAQRGRRARAVATGAAELAVIGENAPTDGLHSIVLRHRRSSS
jgi:DNA-binding transcriptional LysR family regulator